MFGGIAKLCKTATFLLVVRGAKQTVIVAALFHFTTIVSALVSSVALPQLRTRVWKWRGGSGLVFDIAAALASILSIIVRGTFTVLSRRYGNEAAPSAVYIR